MEYVNLVRMNWALDSFEEGLEGFLLHTLTVVLQGILSTYCYRTNHPKTRLKQHFIMSQGFGGSGISRAQQGCSEWAPQKQSQRQEFACKWFVKGSVRERSVKAWERGSRSGKRRKLRQDMISDQVLQRAGFSLIQEATLEGQLYLSCISDVLIWCKGPELSHSYTWQSSATLGIRLELEGNSQACLTRYMWSSRGLFKLLFSLYFLICKMEIIFVSASYFGFYYYF